MAKKKDNFKDMKDTELVSHLGALRESLRTSRFKAEGSKSKNVKEHLFIRKNIARALTSLNSRNSKR